MRPRDLLRYRGHGSHRGDYTLDGIDIKAYRGTKKKLTAGFRSAAREAGGSPFKCSECGEKDMEARNCGNRLGLPEDARAVAEYTDDVAANLREKGARKVVSLAGLRLYECPSSYITSETLELMRAVYVSEAIGGLPCAGGWADQPCWFVEAYEIYKAESREAMKDKGDGER